jgi:hypothetical protein
VQLASEQLLMGGEGRQKVQKQARYNADGWPLTVLALPG